MAIPSLIFHEKYLVGFFTSIQELPILRIKIEMVFRLN